MSENFSCHVLIVFAASFFKIGAFLIGGGKGLSGSVSKI